MYKSGRSRPLNVVRVSEAQLKTFYMRSLLHLPALLPSCCRGLHLLPFIHSRRLFFFCLTWPPGICSSPTQTTWGPLWTWTCSATSPRQTRDSSWRSELGSEFSFCCLSGHGQEAGVYEEGWGVIQAVTARLLRGDCPSLSRCGMYCAARYPCPST